MSVTEIVVAIAWIGLEAAAVEQRFRLSIDRLFETFCPYQQGRKTGRLAGRINWFH